MVLSMKKFFEIVVFAFLLLFSGTETWAQKSELRYADHQFELSNLMEAGKGYEESYGKKANYRAARGAAMTYDNWVLIKRRLSGGLLLWDLRKLQRKTIPIILERSSALGI